MVPVPHWSTNFMVIRENTFFRVGIGKQWTSPMMSQAIHGELSIVVVVKSEVAPLGPP